MRMLLLKGKKETGFINWGGKGGQGEWLVKSQCAPPFFTKGNAYFISNEEVEVPLNQQKFQRHYRSNESLVVSSHVL